MPSRSNPTIWNEKSIMSPRLTAALWKWQDRRGRAVCYGRCHDPTDRCDHPCRRQGHAHEIRPAQGAPPDRGAADAAPSARERRPRWSRRARSWSTGAGREQVESAGGAAGECRPCCRPSSSAPAMPCSRPRQALAGFEGDVLILYGDVPLVSAATMRRMLDRLDDDGRAGRGRARLPARPIPAPMAGSSRTGTAGSSKMVEYQGRHAGGARR